MCVHNNSYTTLYNEREGERDLDTCVSIYVCIKRVEFSLCCGRLIMLFLGVALKSRSEIKQEKIDI